jgi:hypothetical protein
LVNNAHTTAFASFLLNQPYSAFLTFFTFLKVMATQLKSPHRPRKAGDIVQDGVKLVFRHAFGVHGPVRDNVLFVSSENDQGVEQESLLYPVGQHGELRAMQEKGKHFLFH